ncbi:MAG: hypothetical protein ACKV2Q_32935 [Planctomycetaceae bacterium]
MNSTPVACQVWTGSVDESLTLFLAKHLESHSPRLVWREPVNARHRQKDFIPLAIPPLSGSLSDVELCEARLHYENGMLHLISDGTQTRFAGWIEADKAAACPAWVPVGASLFAADALVRSESDVLLQRPAKQTAVQRGLRLSQLNGAEKLATLEYYHQGTLRWWRLTLAANVARRSVS